MKFQILGNFFLGYFFKNFKIQSLNVKKELNPGFESK